MEKLDSIRQVDQKWIGLFLSECDNHKAGQYPNPPVKKTTKNDTISYHWESYAAELDTNVIPDSVFAMQHLKSLSFHGMYCDLADDTDPVYSCWELKQIPAQLTNLTMLEVLDLEGNRIQEVPEDILKLKKLKELNLGDNPHISNLSVLSNLQSLEHLNLNGCKLTHLPIELNQLKKLEVLGLTRNNFDSTEIRRIKNQLTSCQVFF